MPPQIAWLAPPVLDFLGGVQLLLLAGSFACLFEFGVTLLPPSRRAQFLYVLPVALLLGWTLAAFFVQLPLESSTGEWWRLANALAR